MAANIKYLNYHGNEVILKNVKELQYEREDGSGKEPFSHGKAVDNVPIELDFSNGNQTVIAPDGTLVKSAVIVKPETLTAENIADGVNVAGILGTHKGGGGGSIKFVEKRGTYNTEKADGVTVRHNLGVLPDIVTIKGYSAGSKTGDIISIECCPNEDISCYTQTVQARTASGEVSLWSEKTQIANVVGGGLLTVTPNTFSVGGSLFKNAVGVTYEYRVIGGLIERPYVEIALNLDGDGNLIVTGGVPEIEQLNVYVDGVIAKTVDYVHSDEFIVDISDVAREFREYTISVEAVGDSFKAKYPIAFYEPVTGYVVPISGTCGEAVNYTLYGDGTLKIYGTGAMTNYLSASEQPWYSSASKILNVVVDSGISVLGSYAFRDCANLTSVYIADGVTFGINSNDFSNIFHNCTNLNSVRLPTDLVEIPISSFYNCASLINIDIPNSVTSIGNHAFRGCTSLQSITIPDSVTSIGTYVFYGCTALTNIDIPDGVTFGENSSGQCRTFQNCASLTTIRLPSDLKKIGESMFYNCSSLKNITIPASVKTICEFAFYGCASLTSIEILDGVTNIDNYAFYGTAITSIIIPDTVTQILWRAFQDCTKLKTATIGSSVSLIGDNTFLNCSSLTSLIFKDTTTWRYNSSQTSTSGTTISSSSLANATTAATYLRSNYVGYWWHKV